MLLCPGRLRAATGAAVAGVVVLSTSVFAATWVHHPGPNLAPNPGFEQSVTEPTPQLAGKNPQPLLPVGWDFEGATTLFDHSHNVFHTGLRSVAISGSLAGGKELCDPNYSYQACVPLPTAGPESAVQGVLGSNYSIEPFWRTQNPVAVTAGVRYRLSAYMILPSFGGPSLIYRGEGAVSQVRWTDAAGKVVSTAPGPRLVGTGVRPLGWKFETGLLTAPAGATGAILMFGQSNYTTSLQVAFDDVYFGTA